MQCCEGGILCKQRIVLKGARLVGLVHVTVGATHGISGGGYADIDLCSNSSENAAAQRCAVLTRDDGKW